MSLADELAGVLHELTLGYDIDKDSAELIAALDARGIDLELAYQWPRALGALPNQRDHRLWRYGTWRMQTRGPWAINGVTWQAIAEPHNATGVGDDHEIEALGPTPAAALSALADALEAQK